MKRIILAVAVAAFATGAFAQSTNVTPPPAAQLPPDTPASTLLPALAEHSRHVAQLENGRLTGEGADFLRALGAESQFVLVGEEHGNARIAQFVEAYWRDLNGAGFQYAAIETDPWAAAALERELRAGGAERWGAFAAPRGSAIAAPFFTWADEVQLAATIVETSRAREGALWGLDQVFLGSAPWLMAEIAANARDSQARTMASALVEQSSAGGMNWFGRAEAQPLIDLRARLNGRRDRDYAALVDAMLVSQRIYRPFTGGGGEAQLANAEREALMKTTFIARYRAAEAADRAPPRVLLKFGAYHMYRGATPTHVQGLGGFVSELAAANGTRALSILTACGSGSAVASFDRGEVSCTEPFNETWSFLASHTDAQGLTIFDMRVWRLRPGRWAHLPAEIRQMIDSFDLIVVVPNGAATRFLPGLALPAPPPG